MFDQNIPHAWVQARLSDFIDKQLPAAEQKQIENHLRDCAQCRASAESLRWTIGLLKQAPAPTSSRGFMLPVPAKKSTSWTFALAPLATAFATILFFVVLGFDWLAQTGAPAPSAAVPVIAFAATPAPTVLAPKAAAEAATQSSPTVSAAKDSMPASTTPAGALQAPPPAPAFASTPTQAARAVGASAAPSATPTLPPTIVPTPPPQPTKLPEPTPTPAPVTQPILAPLRVIEIALLFAIAVLAAITIILWRRR